MAWILPMSGSRDVAACLSLTAGLTDLLTEWIPGLIYSFISIK